MTLLARLILAPILYAAIYVLHRGSGAVGRAGVMQITLTLDATAQP